MLLDPVTVRLDGIGATAVVPAAGLAVDLSEFNVKDDEACRPAVKRAASAWERLATSARSSLDRLKAVPKPREWRRNCLRVGCTIPLSAFLILALAALLPDNFTELMLLAILVVPPAVCWAILRKDLEALDEDAHRVATGRLQGASTFRGDGQARS